MKFLKIFLLFTIFIIFSCNESNSLSIMQSVHTSRPKTDKTWRQIEVVYSTTNPDKRKVDFGFLLANDGLHIVAQNVNQDDETFLSKASVLNNDEKLKVKGLVRNLYIPSNYDSTAPAVIVQTVENLLGSDSMHYYKLDLKSVEDYSVDNLTISELSFTQFQDSYLFVSKSSVNGSELIMCRSKQSTQNLYTYYVGMFTINGDNIGFSSKKSFESELLFYKFWEDSDELNALVLYSTSGDEDIMEQEYYSLNLSNSGNPEIVYYEKLQGLGINNFIVYSDASFMAISQSGNIIHSSLNRSHHYSVDSAFSYNRYVDPVIFRFANSNTPAVTIFAKYNGNGFIIYSYDKEPTDNKIYNSTTEYKGHIQTGGFAEEFRSEELSEIYPVILKDNNVITYKVVVLSVRNGLTTYTFDSIVPNEMRTNGVDRDGKVELW